MKLENKTEDNLSKKSVNIVFAPKEITKTEVRISTADFIYYKG